MSAASNSLENKIINSVFRGQAFAVPGKTYIALHTSDPGEDCAQGEVSTSTWASYQRQDVAKGGTQADGWTAPADGVTKNALQLLYAAFNGASAITVTHFSIWDAQTAGNPIAYAAFTTARTINPGDVFVIDVQKITMQML